MKQSHCRIFELKNVYFKTLYITTNREMYVLVTWEYLSTLKLDRLINDKILTIKTFTVICV